MGRKTHTNPRRNPPESGQPMKGERMWARVRSWIRQNRWISESEQQMATQRREEEKRQREIRQHEMYPSSEEVQPEDVVS